MPPEELVGFDTEGWVRKFNATLKENPYARASLASIEAEGFPRSVLLRVLAYYTHPASVDYQRRVKAWASRATELIVKCQISMSRLEAHVRQELAAMEMWPTTWRTFTESDAANNLESTRKEMQNLVQLYNRISHERGKRRDEASLVYLCLCIEAATGRRHWSDIAYLLEAAFHANEVNEHWDADSVRKVVARFRKSHSADYNTMMEALHRIDLHRHVKPTNRSTCNRRTKRSKKVSPVVHTLHS